MGYIGQTITTVFPTSISVDSATISGNTTVGGTLGVTGATTLSSTLGVTGVSTLSDNIVFGASSKGVHLGVTSATASNLIDDYEEGSWTPNIGGNATYNNQQGIYTKIGRYVNAHFDITINAIGSGAATILSGFPFLANAGSVTPTMGVYSGHCSYYSDINSNVYSLDMYIINGQTNAYFTGHTAAGGNIGNSLSVFKNSARIVGSVHYFAN